MKKSTDIVNLPVFSITEGKEVGRVSSLLINAEKGRVDYLIVKMMSLEFGIKAIPFERVEGIGDYAVTIEGESAIVELSQVSAAHELLTKNIQLNGNKVITKKGSLLGKIGEYYLDDFSGIILGCLLVAEGNIAEQVVLSEYILTYGNEVVVVQEDILEKLVSYQIFAEKVESLGKKPDGTVEASTDKETVAVSEHTMNAAVEFVAATKEATVSSVDQAMNNVYEATIAEQELDVARQLEDRHILFMKGKRLSKDFLGENGEVLIPKDTFLTEELILRAKALGRSKLLELSMSVGD